MQSDQPSGKLYKLLSNKNLTCLSVGIVVLGIVLRLWIYFQCRCLFIDEANVARNIYERSFGGLTAPLSYEQYAPPLFLWIVKCSTLLFGYGELSYKLFPLLCGIVSLWLMYVALRKYAGVNGMWYTLALMATGVFYLRYGTELKQYGCDAMAVLLLLLLALRIDIFKTSPVKFLGIWFIAGSVAIWLSMPSVFMLAGVGVYYLYICLQERKYNYILLLAGMGLLWVLQFALYYFVILKPQIQSDYLQNCHKEFFLYPIPHNGEQWDHDVNALHKMISAMGGKWALSMGFHLLAIVIGLVFMFKEHAAKAFLVLVPILALIAAAMAHQYALTPRLILFVMPLLLIIVACGVTALFRIRFVAVRVLWIVIAIICINNFGGFKYFHKRMEFEEITKSMAFIQAQKITGDHLYVHNAAGPAYIYYTTIHPAKDKWKDLTNAHILFWNSHYDSVAKTFNGRSALLYSWAPDDEIATETAEIRHYHKQTAQQIVMGSCAFIYE